MTMKKHKSNQYEYDDYDDYDDMPKKKSLSDHRRPIKNWKKAWIEHSDEYEDIEDFYKK